VVGADTLGTFSAAFDGLVDYCELSAVMGPRYACGPPGAVAHVACVSQNHRVVLQRR
jgi:hypothetical protein